MHQIICPDISVHRHCQHYNRITRKSLEIQSKLPTHLMSLSGRSFSFVLSLHVSLSFIYLLLDHFSSHLMIVLLFALFDIEFDERNYHIHTVTLSVYCRCIEICRKEEFECTELLNFHSQSETLPPEKDPI